MGHRLGATRQDKQAAQDKTRQDKTYIHTPNEGQKGLHQFNGQKRPDELCDGLSAATAREEEGGKRGNKKGLMFWVPAFTCQ